MSILDEFPETMVEQGVHPFLMLTSPDYGWVNGNVTYLGGEHKEDAPVDPSPYPVTPMISVSVPYHEWPERRVTLVMGCPLFKVPETIPTLWEVGLLLTCRSLLTVQRDYFVRHFDGIGVTTLKEKIMQVQNHLTLHTDLSLPEYRAAYREIVNMIAEHHF